MDDDIKVNKDLYPILPLRDIVVYPNMVVPLFVGREKSIQALEEVMNNDRELFLVAQKDSTTEDPSEDNLYTHGTVASIMQLLKLPDNTVKVLVEGTSRAKIRNFIPGEKFHQVEVDLVNEIVLDDPEIEATPPVEDTDTSPDVDVIDARAPTISTPSLPDSCSDSPDNTAPDVISKELPDPLPTDTDPAPCTDTDPPSTDTE